MISSGLFFSLANQFCISFRENSVASHALPEHKEEKVAPFIIKNGYLDYNGLSKKVGKVNFRLYFLSHRIYHT